jgi:hypothetical protein
LREVRALRLDDARSIDLAALTPTGTQRTTLIERAVNSWMSCVFPDVCENLNTDHGLPDRFR